MEDRSFPSISTFPPVGISSPPIIWRRVDFPLPLVPTTARNSPFSTEKLTPSRAFTRVSPFPYIFLRSFTSSIFIMPPFPRYPVQTSNPQARIFFNLSVQRVKRLSTEVKDRIAEKNLQTVSEISQSGDIFSFFARKKYGKDTSLPFL